MSKVKKSKRKNRIIPILVVVSVVILLLLVICIGIFVKKNYKKDEQIVDPNDKGVTEFNEDVVQDEEQSVVQDENLDQGEEQSMEQDKNNVQDETAFYEIETKYCKLYFPESWKEQIEVKFSEEVGYKAEFYGLVEGKTAQHLFDVCFNSDDGDLLGYLENGDEIVNISIDVMELVFDESWNQEEINQLYSMQEEMNYVMSSLSRNENYVEP